MKARYLFFSAVLVVGVIGIVYFGPIFGGALGLAVATVSVWLFMPQILIVLPALLPFQPALNPTADIDLAAGRLIITFLAVIGSICIIYKRKAWFNLSTPTILVMFFLLWSLFSGLAAGDLDRFARKYLVFLTIFPIYFLLLAFLRRFKDWKKLFQFWSWSAFVVSLIGLVQFLFQFIGGQQAFFKFWGNFVAPILYGTNAGEAVASNPSWFVGISGVTVLRAIGTFPDPHMLAFFLGMSLPLQISYVLGHASPLLSSGQSRFMVKLTPGSRRWGSKIFWILPSLSFIVLLLTFSRGSYVGLAGVLAWLAIHFWRNHPKKKLYGTRQRLIMGGLLIIILSYILPPVRDRFLSILDVGEGSNRGRLEIWEEALSVTLKNPVFGVGLGNYASVVRPEAKYREPIYAHNTYLDLSSEIGLPGTAAWILIIIFCVSPLWRDPLRSSFSEVRGMATAGDRGRSVLAVDNYNLAASLGILWFSLHAFFETPVYSPQILPLVLVLVAFRVYAQERFKSQNK